MGCNCCNGKDNLLYKRSGGMGGDTVSQRLLIYKGTLFSYVTVKKPDLSFLKGVPMPIPEYDKNTSADWFALINYCPICGSKLNKGYSRLRHRIGKIKEFLKGYKGYEPNSFNIQIDIENETKIITCKKCKDETTISIYEDSEKIKRKHKCSKQLTE